MFICQQVKPDGDGYFVRVAAREELGPFALGPLTYSQLCDYALGRDCFATAVSSGFTARAALIHRQGDEESVLCLFDRDGLDDTTPEGRAEFLALPPEEKARRALRRLRPHNDATDSLEGCERLAGHVRRARAAGRGPDNPNFDTRADELRDHAEDLAGDHYG